MLRRISGHAIWRHILRGLLLYGVSFGGAARSCAEWERGWKRTSAGETDDVASMSWDNTSACEADAAAPAWDTREAGGTASTTRENTPARTTESAAGEPGPQWDWTIPYLWYDAAHG
ncbi:hypothetical protein IU433_25965 [Nocardia puris]|uniref:hypothetical protein n=1 Tax=Nocardia puris TaxID=208602 RepID=UPI0018961024|nr:hypothetical protein [Nocardia puris]MBF6214644.1 hypothetical protein [Nocardia puris]MBF6368881.1 hypothetical protein [Nocardia puris]MBF6462462.1 hypothetical protein [Nocardia puris]